MYKHLLLLLISAMFAVVVECNSDIYEKCGDQYHCIEKELIKYIDNLDQKKIPLFGDAVVIEKRANGEIETFRKEENFIERCIRYLASRELKVTIPSPAAARALDNNGERSSKLKKIVLPILILLKLKAAIIVPIVLSIIGLVAFKGLGASLVALAIAGATGLKSLLENHYHNSKLTYEVVPQIGPHWSRQGLEAAAAAVHQPANYHTIANY